MGRIFNVGDEFTFTNKYGNKYTCKVKSKEIINNGNASEFLAKMVYSCYGKETTVEIKKSEQRDSYGDEYFVSDVSYISSNDGEKYGVEHRVFPNATISNSQNNNEPDWFDNDWD